MNQSLGQVSLHERCRLLHTGHAGYRACPCECRVAAAIALKRMNTIHRDAGTFDQLGRAHKSSIPMWVDPSQWRMTYGSRIPIHSYPICLSETKAGSHDSPAGWNGSLSLRYRASSPRLLPLIGVPLADLANLGEQVWEMGFSALAEAPGETTVQAH